MVVSTLSEEERVLSGVLRYVREAADADASLPGELKLSEWLDCTRLQVRVALGQLQREGIVKRRQGAPTTVDPIALKLSSRFEQRMEYGEILSRMGYTASLEILSTEIVDLPSDVEPLLSPLAQQKAIRIMLRWFADDRPAMVAEYILALPEGASLDPHQITPTDSVFVSAHKLWGEAVAWEVVTAGVSTLDQSWAELLDLPVNSASKTWEVVGVTLSGERVFHSYEHHHPNLVMYSFVRTIRAPWGGPLH
ncbi:GntR family transcriptional regulator [Lysinibacter cavernae]|uniref:DNA-binding GntR family transcriptional regulator n=1 Tax=Lysinibacter cavernae TaxID=1640652 RepID=A0A7X5R392_9MICO|nr:DNA-binding GntR family transcriptional regulator [Lysinibacter cavernae]